MAELPKPIIHHILSFLPTEEATKASVVSKAWLRAWRTRPVLEFGDGLTFPSKTHWYLTKRQREKKYRKLLKYVFSTLRRYYDERIGIETFRLILGKAVFDQCHNLLDQCIELVEKLNVKNLHLSVPRYNLDPRVFGFESLQDLSLQHCFVMLDGEIIRWRKLKRLRLHVNLFGEQTFENIIASCPLLEILELVSDGCCGHNLKVMNHSNLRQLTVELQRKLTLVLGEGLPKLESFTCGSYHKGYWMADGMPGRLRLHSSKYETMKILVLYNIKIGDDLFNGFAGVFPNVEELSIQSCAYLRRIQISSHSIKRLELRKNHGLSKADLDVPRISQFAYRNKMGSIPELSFTDVSGPWESRVDVHYSHFERFWFVELKKLLASLVDSKILLRVRSRYVPGYEIDEIRHSYAYSEPQKVEQLCMDFRFKRSPSWILPVLDAIFSTCHPRVICLPMDGIFKDNIFLNSLVYEMLMSRRNRDETKPWQDDLKAAEARACEEKYHGTMERCRGYGRMDGEAFNWEGFLDVSRALDRERRICFDFEWETPETPREAKRLKPSPGL